MSDPGVLPSQLGFQLPAEFEPHAATWLTWPQNYSDWPGKYSTVVWTYCEMIRWLHSSEPVHILVNNAATAQRARRLLERLRIDLTNIHFHVCRTDRSWIRDNGPTFLRGPNGQLAALNWKFNAWARYKHWQNDDRVPAYIARLLRIPCWSPTWKNRHVVLEGGAIETNGCGTLLTTRQCLLSGPHWRNPGFTQSDYEEVFARYFNIKHAIWLEAGIAGDDTQGHIDDIARFANQRLILAAEETDRLSSNYDILQKNLSMLRTARSAEGKPFDIITIPMPKPTYYRHWKLPATYLNFYITNRYVLVPTFNDPSDRIALNLLAQAFKDREIVGIHSLDLVVGLGAVHCATLHQPAP